MGLFSGVASIAGGLLGKKASGDAADAQKDAARAAAREFMPYNVSTPLGYASVTGGLASAQLSGQGTQIINRYASEANKGWDVAADRLYQKMQTGAARDERDIRRDTRERLFASGRLGTHSGVREIGEVERALANARLDREMNAYTMSANNRQNAFNNYALMAQLPASNLIAAGLNRNPAAVTASQGMINAGYAKNSGDMAFTKGLIGGLQESGLGSWFDDKMSNIFSSGGGGGFGGASSQFLTDTEGSF